MRRLVQVNNLVAQETLGFFDAALQVTDGVHLAQVHADSNQGLGDFRREARDDHRRAQQAGGLNRLNEVVGHVRVHNWNPRNIDDHYLRAVGSDAA